MQVSPKVVRNGGKLITVVACAVGAGLGVAQVNSALSSDDDDSERGARAGLPAVLPPPAGDVRGDRVSGTLPASDVTVMSSQLRLAATRRGIADGRARLTVRARVVNRRMTPLPLRARLLVAGRALRIDPRAVELPSGLPGPVPPGQTAEGELRFETAGADTTALRRENDVRLRLAGKLVPITVALDG